MAQSNELNHYFTEKQDSEFREKEIKFHLNNLDFQFSTGSGVFSVGKPDKGSILLCKSAVVKGKVLDLGCGWGLVGIYIKKKHPEIEMYMSDVNERALFLARKNAKRNHVKVKIVKSDGFKRLDNFDTILFNPPQHAGKELCMRLIEDAVKHLNKGGTFQLVCRHQKGGRSFEKKMQEYGEVEAIAKSGGYRVYLLRTFL